MTNNNQTIFDMQNVVNNINNMNMQNSFSSMTSQSSMPLNPMKKAFEQNRNYKEGKILYYASAVTDYKVGEGLETLSETTQMICKTKEAHCLIGVGRTHLHIQYYSTNGELLFSNYMARSMFKEIRLSYYSGLTLIQFYEDKKNHMEIYIPDNLKDISGIPKFEGNDQFLVAKNIRDGIKNGDLLI